MRPDNQYVIIRKWQYLGGAICYNCGWETSIAPAPNKCPRCNNYTNSRFKGTWRRESRAGFGLTCPSCKDSRIGSRNRILKGRNWYKNVKKGEKLICKLCGTPFTSKTILT